MSDPGEESDHRHRQLRVRGQHYAAAAALSPAMNSRRRIRNSSEAAMRIANRGPKVPWGTGSTGEHRAPAGRAAHEDRGSRGKQPRVYALCRRGSRSNRPAGKSLASSFIDDNEQVLSGMHSYIRRVDRQQGRELPIAAHHVRRGGCDRRSCRQHRENLGEHRDPTAYHQHRAPCQRRAAWSALAPLPSQRPA